MITRLAIAAVGGLVITVGMLLMMSDFTARLRERDTLRYFRITDVLPYTGPRTLEPPRAPELPPQRPRSQYQRGAGEVLPSTPTIDQPAVPRPAVEPTLDPTLVTPDEPEAR